MDNYICKNGTIGMDNPSDPQVAWVFLYLSKPAFVRVTIKIIIADDNMVKNTDITGLKSLF